MRTRGLTLIELAAGALLAGVLASAAVVNFHEADLRARLARSQALLQDLAMAMEAYNIDNDQYLPSAANSPLGGSTTSSADQRLLTTPVSYLAQQPIDPLRPQVDGTYYFFAAGIHSWGTISYSIYPHTTYMGWSNGPDGVIQSGGYRSLTQVIANEALPEPKISPGQLAWNGMRYDPTNGLTSIGDIYHFGPFSE